MGELISDKDKMQSVRSSVLFSGMDDDTIDDALLFFEARIKKYEKGEFLLHSGELSDCFGLVLSGSVEVCVDDIEGSRMIMADVESGNTFGEAIAFLHSSDIPIYIIATENTEILVLSPKNLFLNNNGEAEHIFEKRFTAMLARRTLKMNNRIQVLSKIKLRDKLITYFSELSSQSKCNTVYIPMSRESLAAYLGTNRSALSRELSRMKSEGIIDIYRNTVKIIECR